MNELSNPMVGWLTFGLLATAIFSVWIKPLDIGLQLKAPAWVIFFTGAIVAGLISGVLIPIAVFELSLLCAAASIVRRAGAKTLQGYLASVLLVVLALAMAFHRLPGFNNPVIVETMTWSPGGISFKQYANFDKGSVGLILLAMMSNRTSSFADMRRTFSRTLPVLLATIVLVLGTAFFIGLIKLDLKFTLISTLFLVTNLFFTVIAEEAFFRGFFQERLLKSLSSLRFGRHISVLCSALAFGIVHAPGGAAFMLLASMAGLGYAYAYQVTRRIESPIIVHFVLNVVHCLVFTYPRLG